MNALRSRRRDDPDSSRELPVSYQTIHCSRARACRIDRPLGLNLDHVEAGGMDRLGAAV